MISIFWGKFCLKNQYFIISFWILYCDYKQLFLRSEKYSFYYFVRIWEKERTLRVKVGHIAGYNIDQCFTINLYFLISDTNECRSNPCMNFGTCVNTEGGFSCICPDGWTGPLCGTGNITIFGSHCVACTSVNTIRFFPENMN
jgi:hypothetical protein